MSDWAKASGRGCEECPSPAAWCRACQAEARAGRHATENAALRVEMEKLARRLSEQAQIHQNLVQQRFELEKERDLALAKLAEVSAFYRAYPVDTQGGS